MTAATLNTAAAVLDTAAARRLTARIRDALAIADNLLAAAFAGRAWEALGHVDWPAYCAAELPELRHIKLRRVERQARVAALHAEGATQRDIMAATGASLGTINADVAALTRPAPAEPAAPVCKTARTLELLEGGPLTVHQLVKRTRWSQTSASATLCRLAAAGRIDYRPPAKRGQVGVYALR
jgi:hypothetical protein